VILHIRDTESVLCPGEVKSESAKWSRSESTDGCIVGVKTVEEMTIQSGTTQTDVDIVVYAVHKAAKGSAYRWITIS